MRLWCWPLPVGPMCAVRWEDSLYIAQRGYFFFTVFRLISIPNLHHCLLLIRCYLSSVFYFIPSAVWRCYSMLIVFNYINANTYGHATVHLPCRWREEGLLRFARAPRVLRDERARQAGVSLGLARGASVTDRESLKLKERYYCLCLYGFKGKCSNTSVKY